MITKDARTLSPEAQEDLRRRVVAGMRQQRMSQSEAARVFGVSRAAVNGWVKKFRQQGAKGLKGRPRGRPPSLRLAPHQAATTVRIITSRCPDQLRLPFALWTREAVQKLLADRFGVSVSVWTVGRYLKRWGLTPQKPLRRAYEQDPKAVREWLETEYPRIRAQAKKEQAEIHWGDQMGLRSDHQVGRSYGKRGRTPVILGTGQRFRCQMMSTVTNRGEMAFMVFHQDFTGRVMLHFLRRLLRHTKRKIYLIVDRHPVHRSGRVQRWLTAHSKRIRMFFLPAYSPQLNPDELLNQDVKSNAVGRERPRSRDEMIAQVRSYLRGTQRRPDIVTSYFREKHVAYAAA